MDFHLYSMITRVYEANGKGEGRKLWAVIAEETRAHQRKPQRSGPGPAKGPGSSRVFNEIWCNLPPFLELYFYLYVPLGEM